MGTAPRTFQARLSAMDARYRIRFGEQRWGSVEGNGHRAAGQRHNNWRPMKAAVSLGDFASHSDRRQQLRWHVERRFRGDWRGRCTRPNGDRWRPATAKSAIGGRGTTAESWRHIGVFGENAGIRWLRQTGKEGRWKADLVGRVLRLGLESSLKPVSTLYFFTL